MAEMIVRLLSKLTVDAIYDLPPAERCRFADALRHWAGVCDRADLPPRGYARAGVLARLDDEERAP